MSTGWNQTTFCNLPRNIINLLGNEYWLELFVFTHDDEIDYKPTGK